MTISLRSERAPAELTLLIHMGAGAVQTVVNAAVRNYGEYRSVTTDGLGLFTVSVFAIDDSRSENDILAALPHRSFARITVGAVTRAGYGLQIGRAHVSTPVTNAQLVCRHLLKKTKTDYPKPINLRTSMPE